MRQNRPIPGWIRLRTDNKIRFFIFFFCLPLRKKKLGVFDTKSPLFLLHAGTTLSVGIGAVPSSGSRSSELAAMTLIRSSFAILLSELWLKF